MKQYKWKYMTEPALKEIDELLEGEHGSALTLWSMECGNAGAKGLSDGIGKGILLGAAAGAVFAAGMFIKEKIRQKKFKKAIEDFNESTKNDVGI